MLKGGHDTNYTFNKDMMHLPLSVESPQKNEQKDLSIARLKHQPNNLDLQLTPTNGQNEDLPIVDDFTEAALNTVDKRRPTNVKNLRINTNAVNSEHEENKISEVQEDTRETAQSEVQMIQLIENELNNVHD